MCLKEHTRGVGVEVLKVAQALGLAIAPQALCQADRLIR
jgi:hypothetical protein